MALSCRPPLLMIAPAPPTPAPDTLTGSCPRFCAFTSRVAPLETSVPPKALPSAVALPALSVPPWMSVVPG